MICPNQPLDCEAKRRLGSREDPEMINSQPAKCGPVICQFRRWPSAVRIEGTLLVPTGTRTLLMEFPFSVCDGCGDYLRTLAGEREEFLATLSYRGSTPARTPDFPGGLRWGNTAGTSGLGADTRAGLISSPASGLRSPRRVPLTSLFTKDKGSGFSTVNRIVPC